jgi:ABC-type branched-subunit amino acid transport system ATPase component
MILKLNNIQASYYPGNPILKGIDLELGEGEKIVILGRNGAGKTTLANTVFGLVPHQSGEIHFKGKDLRMMPPERISSAGIGYFMQGAPVFPQLSVKENLHFAQRSKTNDLSSAMEEISRSLPMLAENRFLGMPAGSLSGGERTQLAIGMAILNSPGLLILDEPFAGLSPSNATLVLQILQDFHSRSRASMILIAQDRISASEFSDRQVILKEGILSTE